MRLSKVSRKGHKRGSANITSLVDIALSLLIFFIVTLPALLESGIFVKAPGVKQVGGSDPGDEFKVAIRLRIIDDSTYYFLNDEPIDKKDMGPLIEALLQRSTEKLVVVRADGAVTHAEVVEMLDLAKQKKAKRLALLRGKPLPEEGG